MNNESPFSFFKFETFSFFFFLKAQSGDFVALFGTWLPGEGWITPELTCRVWGHLDAIRLTLPS